MINFRVILSIAKSWSLRNAMLLLEDALKLTKGRKRNVAIQQ